MPKAIEHAHDAILATTRGLLLTEGYDSLTMRSIAAASGIATGTIYNYYSAKDEIVYAVMLEDWRAALEGMDRDLEDVSDDAEKVEGLRPIFMRLRNFTATYSDVWRRMALPPKEGTASRVQCYDRTLFMQELSQRIQGVFGREDGGAEGERGQEQAGISFEAGFVARIFSLYAMEKDFEYSRLENVLRKMFPRNPV